MSARLIEGEDFPDPNAPLLPEEGWTSFVDGVVGGSFEKIRKSENFKTAIAEMKNGE